MKRFILKYQNEFGIIMTTEYQTKKEYDFWKDIREQQGYKLIIK